APTAVVLALCWLAQAAETPPPRYGDRGTQDLSVALGYGADGLIVGGGYRRFFWQQIAPGLEATAQLGGQKTGFVLASLRFVPLSRASVALSLTPKGGRVLLADHGDGWAAGGDAGIIVMVAPGAGLELGYEVLRLLPGSFC